MRRPSLVALAGVVAVLLLLAACGGDGDSAAPPPEAATTGASDTPATSPGETAAPTETTSEATSEPVTIEVWDYGYGPDEPGTPGNPLRRLDEEFMKQHPNITIDHKGFPYNTQFQKVRTAVASREGPDVVMMFPGLFSADYQEGLLPLESYVEADPELSDQVILLEESHAPDGHLYALPWGAYAYVWLYNKELFQQAGLDPENPPATWDELLAACDALREAGITPVAAGWKDGFHLDWFQFVHLAQLLSPDDLAAMTKLEFPFTSPEFAAADQYVLDMAERGCFDEGAIGRVLEDAHTDFVGGKAAMVLWAGVDPTWEEQIGTGNLGVFLPPPLPDADPAWEFPFTDAGPANGWAITNWSEHPDEAWEYVRFLMSPEAQAIVWEMNRTPPTNLASDVSADTEPLQAYLDAVGLEGNHTAYMSIPPTAQATHQRFAVPLITGDASIEEVLERIENDRQKVQQKLGASP